MLLLLAFIRSLAYTILEQCLLSSYIKTRISLSLSTATSTVTLILLVFSGTVECHEHAIVVLILYSYDVYVASSQVMNMTLSSLHVGAHSTIMIGKFAKVECDYANIQVTPRTRYITMLVIHLLATRDSLQQHVL